MTKKIFFIGSYADSLINFRLQLMQEFIKKDYEVVALAPHDEKTKETLSAQNIRYISIPLNRNGTNPINDIWLFFNLKKLFLAEKPDIVFAYTIKPIIYASLAARSAKIKQIYSLVTGVGYVFINEGLKSKAIGFFAKSFLKLALHFNKKIFFQNSDNLFLFTKKKIISKNKNTTVVNGSGVDCTHFSPTEYPKQLSFLMIARLLNSKGIYEYIAAVKTLKEKYPHVLFRLAGWIDTNPGSISQKELDEWINEGSIEFLGKLSDVRNCIANTSVYVLPSWAEGMPRTVLEAMAMGRPIITTDTSGCKETVIQYKNGLLVPPKNVNELCNAMEYFILFPEKVIPMGSESRKMALEKYDVNKVNADMLMGMGIH